MLFNTQLLALVAASLLGPTLAQPKPESKDSTTENNGPLNPKSIQIPSFDFDGLGRMGIVGDFDSISTYEYAGQQSLVQQSLSASAGSSAVVGYNDNITQYLHLATLDGVTTSTCELGNHVYFAGNFTKIGDSTSAPAGVAYLDKTSGNVTALPAPSSDQKANFNTIKTLYCDSDNSNVYVAGDVTLNSTQGVVVWDEANSEWTSPLFGGFGSNSTVNSIAKFGSNLVFGGQFWQIGANASTSFSGKDHDKSSDLVTLVSLEQQVSFALGQLQAEGTTSGSDPSSIYCPGDPNANWALTDNRQGTWQLALPFTFNPTRLRMYNLNDDENGTKTFRFLAFPLNGIMNFTYIDPDSGDEKTCDAWCPLPQRKSQPFVDFFFVNPVQMDSFQVFVLDFYGAAAGLGGVELFQQNLVTYANDSYNQPVQCQKSDVTASTYGKTTLKGSSWKTLSEPGLFATYLSATLNSAADLGDYSVRMQPNITAPGEYSVVLYTPGCTSDGTCAQRGGVKVSVYPSKGASAVEKISYQTNEFEKYEQVYNGTLKPTSDFQPYVEVVPLPDQTAFPLVFVAEKTMFNMDFASLNQTLLEAEQEEERKHIKLNGLFEYSHDNFTQWTKNSSFAPVGYTFVNSAATNFSQNATINGLYALDSNKLAIGGQFALDKSSNFAIVSPANDGQLQIDSSSTAPYSDAVESFVGFSDGSGVAAVFGNNSGAAYYDSKQNKWSTIPGTSPQIAVYNQSVFAVSSGSSSLQLYNVSSGSVSTPQHIKGEISTSYLDSDNQFYFGQLQSFDHLAQSAIFLGQDLQVTGLPSGFEFVTPSTSSTNSTSSKTKRDLTIQSSTGNSINTGVFLNNTVAVLAGTFNATYNKNTISNVAIITNSSVAGLSEQLEGEVFSLLLDNSTNRLFIGGDISGTVQQNDVGGIAIYYINNSTFATIQPPAVSGDANTVTSVQLVSDLNQLAVMGSFTQAGSLGCPGLCIYDLGQSRWLSPGSGFSGSISTSQFIASKTVFFAGDLQMNSSTAYFAQYDFTTSEFSYDPKLSHNLPGPVQSFVLNGEGVDSIFASGVKNSTEEAYLGHWNGSAWTMLDAPFEQGTTIYQVSLLALNTQHESNNILPQNEVLMVSGNIQLRGFGSASVVLFDGENWQPLFVTTSSAGTGTVKMFYSQSSQEFSNLFGKHHMKRGFVVLVSLAIAIGLVMLMVLLGLALAAVRKRRQGYRPANSRVSGADMTETVPPANLLHAMDTMKG